MKDELIQSVESAYTLLAGFNRHIANRSRFLFYTDGSVTEEILKLHRHNWKIEWSNLGKDTNVWHSYYMLGRALDETLQSVQERLIVEEPLGLHSFFKLVDSHLRLYVSDTLPVNGAQRRYIDEIPFFYSFFDAVAKAKDHGRQTWSAFPKEWLVRIDNLGTGTVAAKWFESFWEWFSNQIGRGEPGYSMDVAVSELFPDVDPSSWAIILSFLYRPDPAWLVSRKGTIDVMTRPISFYGDGIEDPSLKFERAQQQLEFESARLTAYLAHHSQRFADVFGKYDRHLSAFYELKVEGDEELNRRRIVRIFELIKKAMEEYKHGGS